MPFLWNTGILPQICLVSNIMDSKLLIVLKGTVQAKIDQIKKKNLPLMKYQHVADVVEFNSCATCVKRV